MLNLYDQMNNIDDNESLAPAPIGYKVTYETPGSWYSKYLLFDSYNSDEACFNETIAFINRWLYGHEHPKNYWYTVCSSIELKPLYEGRIEGNARLRIDYVMYPSGCYEEDGTYNPNVIDKPKTYKVILTTKLSGIKLDANSPKLIVDQTIVSPEDVFTVQHVDKTDYESEVNAARLDMKRVKYQYDPKGYSDDKAYY